MFVIRKIAFLKNFLMYDDAFMKTFKNASVYMNINAKICKIYKT